MADWDDSQGMYWGIGFPAATPESMAEAIRHGNAMRVTLPRYSGPKPTCLKCGKRSASTQHCDGPTGGIHAALAFGDGDGLWRNCRRCGYQWQERAMDDAG